MYAWGGSTAGWKGSKKYDFGSARAKYDKAAIDAGATGTRTYTGKKVPNMDLADPKGKVIRSGSTDPIIIATDVTGSMAKSPGEFFDRLPLLYQTLAKYRPEAEFSFCAIGDATCDDYPLQVNEFTKEIKDLESAVKALGCEGGGGGHITESYELFGYFMLKHCETPKATSPFLIIYGDETFYEEVEPRQTEHYIGDKLQAALNSAELWKNLLQKFNVYFLQKPYGSGDSGTTREVKERWAGALGLQRVIDVPDPERAGDVAMGLIAKNWGEYRDFSISLDARHDDPDVKASVHKSLRHVDADPSVKSVTKGKKASKMTAPLV